LGAEVVSRRTQYSRTYKTVSGAYATIMYPGSVNYKNASGAWRRIDDALVAGTGPGVAYQNKANAYSLLLPSNLCSGVQISRGGVSAQFSLVGANASPRAAKGQTATYANALPNVDVEIVAINDLFDTKTNAHLLKYDSNYGRFDGTIEARQDALIVNGKHIQVLAERDWTKLGWDKLGVELVIESTGVGTAREAAARHLEAGAKKVIISAPAKDEDLTMVLGVNDDKYDPGKHNIISNASCTTNGLAPVVKVLLDNFGIKHGLMSTVHSYTNSQKVLDLAGPDLRDARAAALNIVPASTGAAKAVALVIPEVRGKFDGIAYRVPTPTVSIVDFVVDLEKDSR